MGGRQTVVVRRDEEKEMTNGTREYTHLELRSIADERARERERANYNSVYLSVSFLTTRTEHNKTK